MFEVLTAELEKWAAAGLTAQFWWRDDDVQQPSAALQQLLSISARYQASLSLAAIPEGSDKRIAIALSRHAQVTVLQHGYSHRNYAPPKNRKMELGDHRPRHQILTQLVDGLTRFRLLFGRQFMAVLVPPWNRIDTALVEQLAAIGFIGLSDLGARPAAMNGAIKRVNVHVDLIDWRNRRRFVGAAVCIAQICAHLSAKRERRADQDEATGIMSHHLVHDADCWCFLDRLLDYLSNQKAVRMMTARDLF